ncbi:MAG TPA: contractile injection system tape measure protein, partial [Phnomibacter sp.]|nr:contractile injection system tape measure protein [Phnomibacter sp.]
VPFETVIDSNTGIPGEWKEEADHLLSAVITHWSKLGNTSVAALRHSFLQRDGQLELKESRNTLKIPERTEDILLQFIPWSFRMIRLPWMKQLLETEWT